MKKECKHHKGEYTYGENKFCDKCHLALSLSKSIVERVFQAKYPKIQYGK